MPDSRAQRTLVKSPPELWAEVSDPQALTRLFGEGEIRITRLEPETTVAWEGDRVRGTVELEPSGWGTKVILTARSAAREAPAPPVEEEVAPPSAVPASATAPLPAATRRPGLLALFRRRPRAEPTAPEGPPEPEDPPPPADAAPLHEPPAPHPSVDVEAVLAGVLDDLGSAQKRPFSR